MEPVFEFKPARLDSILPVFTMQHIHGPVNWTGQMLKEGVAGTLGAVNEPYVTAFPFPDDFFPLLLTGKLSLAEVYWEDGPVDKLADQHDWRIRFTHLLSRIPAAGRRFAAATAAGAAIWRVSSIPACPRCAPGSYIVSHFRPATQGISPVADNEYE